MTYFSGRAGKLPYWRDPFLAIDCIFLISLTAAESPGDNRSCYLPKSFRQLFLVKFGHRLWWLLSGGHVALGYNNIFHALWSIPRLAKIKTVSSSSSQRCTVTATPHFLGEHKITGTVYSTSSPSIGAYIFLSSLFPSRMKRAGLKITVPRKIFLHCRRATPMLISISSVYKLFHSDWPLPFMPTICVCCSIYKWYRLRKVLLIAIWVENVSE